MVPPKFAPILSLSPLEKSVIVAVFDAGNAALSPTAPNTNVSLPAPPVTVAPDLLPKVIVSSPAPLLITDFS